MRNGDRRPFNAACEAFLLAREARKAAEERYNIAKATVTALLGDGHWMKSGSFEAQLVNNQKNRMDMESFKEKYPYIYVKFLKKEDCWTLTVWRLE